MTWWLKNYDSMADFSISSVLCIIEIFKFANFHNYHEIDIFRRGQRKYNYIKMICQAFNQQMLTSKLSMKNSNFCGIWGLGCINLVFFKRFHVIITCVSTADAADFRKGVLFTPSVFERPQKNQAK